MCVCMPWGRGTTILFTYKPRVVVSVNTHTHNTVLLYYLPESSVLELGGWGKGEALARPG